MSSKEQHDEDMSIYHPHDLLIAKHFPEKDLPSTGYDSLEYSGLYRSAQDREKWGDEPRQIPWPRPPVRPRESQKAGVEQWRSRALEAVNSHIALFTSGSAQQRTRKTQASRASLSPSSAVTPHRLLLIPELLELILRQATPEAQHAAWDVNRLWRSTMEHILTYQYRTYHLCPPVEYGERIDTGTDLSHIEPSDADIAIVEQEAVNLSQKPLYELAEVYYPANIAQASSLSDSVYIAIRTSYERLRWKPAESDPIDWRRRWVDFSQIGMNPQVAELFGNRMEMKLGRCEIALKASAHQPCLLKGSLPSGKFATLVADMFLTEPPCKALGIYMGQLHSSNLQLLTRVCDGDGIRVRQFLDALLHHAEELLSRWFAQSEILRQRLSGEWTELSTAEQKRYPWIYHGSPKFVVFFEGMDEGPATLAHKAYGHGEDSRAVRRNEWFCNTFPQ